MAKLLQSALRSGDSLFRYGGDEFAAILPDTGSQGAFVIAERMRRTVQSASWSTTRATTLSIGVGSVDDSLTSPMDLLEAADYALLDAKHNGRNRVSTAVRRI